MSAVLKMQIAKFGGRLQEFSETPTATTTSQPLIKADGERVQLTVINNSATVVWARFGNPGAAGLGLRLAANGGGFTIDFLEDPNLISMAIYFIVASGTAALDVFGSRRFDAGEGA